MRKVGELISTREMKEGDVVRSAPALSRAWGSMMVTHFVIQDDEGNGIVTFSRPYLIYQEHGLPYIGLELIQDTINDYEQFWLLAIQTFRVTYTGLSQDQEEDTDD